MLRISEKCLEIDILSEYKDVLKKITNKGRLYVLMILKQQNDLYEIIPPEKLADLFNINCSRKSNMTAKVRKAMNDLFPIVGHELKRINSKDKQWYYSNIEIYLKEPQSGFTQLPCDLLKIPNMKPDLLVVFVILNYYKTIHNNLDINPSHKTIAKLAGCSERKIYTLLEEGKKIGIWKYEAVKGTKSTNTYNISYLDDEEFERYYFRDVLETIERENLELEKFMKKEAISS